MFKRALLAKFEWENLPEPLNDLFVEALILNSSTRNFCVVNHREYGELWTYFDVLEPREKRYGIPRLINAYDYYGVLTAYDDFVLFNNFGNQVSSDYVTIIGYERILRKVNRALEQHVDASNLIATVYAISQDELKELEKRFKDYPGIVSIKVNNNILEGGRKVDFIQFQITPRTAELEELKHNLENDLWLRLGIDTGTDKTHITVNNLQDSEQARDLINAYEIKLREDFCKRYNAWKKPAKPLAVRIHTITPDNAIERSTASTGGQNNADE